MGVYGFCRFVSITGSALSPSVLVVVVVVVCQCFGVRPRRGSWLSSVVVRCQFSRNSCRRGLLPVFVNGFAVRSVGFGSSPFFVNLSSALGIGVSLTYFVKFVAAADYSFPLYIKIKRPKWLTDKNGGVTDYDKELLLL